MELPFVANFFLILLFDLAPQAASVEISTPASRPPGI
jgi:hypothetical protein